MGTSFNRHAVGALKLKKECIKMIQSNLSEQEFNHKLKVRIYREMVNDAEEAINNPRLSFEGSYAILHNITWNWTQYEGTFLGNPLWSKNALDNFEAKYPNLYYSHGQNTSGDSFSTQIKVMEDHVVPRKVLLRHLLGPRQSGLTCYTEAEINNNIEVFLHTYLLSCILTEDENKLRNRNGMKDDMPEKFYKKSSEKFYRNPWSRYLAQRLDDIFFPEIEVYRVKWEKKKVGRRFVWTASPVKAINLDKYIHCYLNEIPVSLSWHL